MTDDDRRQRREAAAAHAPLPPGLPQQDDMDVLLTMLGAAGCNFVMGIPGSDDIMLNYQSTSFHDALYVRRVLGLKPAPQFEAWLHATQIFTADATLAAAIPPRFQPALLRLD